MGACCAAREKDRESDLPPPEIKGNEFQKFELAQPFGRTYADTFERRVRRAAANDLEAKKGDGKTVTVESLRQTFKTPAWNDINNNDSSLCKLLNSSVFKHKKGKDKIWADWLILFGVLHCAGDAKAKSEALYSVL